MSLTITSRFFSGRNIKIFVPLVLAIFIIHHKGETFTEPTRELKQILFQNLVRVMDLPQNLKIRILSPEGKTSIKIVLKFVSGSSEMNSYTH